MGRDADSEIVHEPDRHARGAGLVLGVGELLVGEPGEPLVEADVVGEFGAGSGDCCRAWIAQVGRPRVPVAGVYLREGAPGGEVGEFITFALDERGEGSGAAGTERRRPVDAAQGTQLEGAYSLPVDQGLSPQHPVVEGARLCHAGVDVAPLGRVQIRVLGYRLHPQVQGIWEAA